MRDSRRQDRRMKESRDNAFSIKNTLYVAGTILALGIIAFVITIMVYNNNVNKLYAELDETKDIGQESMSNVLEEASSTIGKTVEEMTNELENSSIQNEKTQETTASENTVQIQETKQEEIKQEENKKEEVKDTNVEETKKEEAKKLAFTMPVEGEIQKEYAKDKLVYSDTLKEWVTHTGIDIKADKTTVVKSAEDGKVTAIKNDPRYGTTVIVEHSDGYETRYANLLTAEFVTVGEKITKGQTIGTVGDTGSFEILDEPHLHFELLKNGEYQDPTSVIE